VFVFRFAFEYFVSSDCPMILCYYFMTQKKTFSHMCIICETHGNFSSGPYASSQFSCFPHSDSIAGDTMVQSVSGDKMPTSVNT